MADVPNNYFRTCIKALIFDEQKRFIMTREDNGLWEMLGGGLNFGEKPEECLKRELLEEAHIEVAEMKQRPFYFVTALNINGIWKSAVYYETIIKSLDFQPSSECQELRFFTKEEALKERLYPIVREFLQQFDPNNH